MLIRILMLMLLLLLFLVIVLVWLEVVWIKSLFFRIVGVVIHDDESVEHKG